MDMKRHQLKRRKIINTSIGINQLPEQIFHEIFKYLKYNTIITSLREVSTIFRQHVDTFISIIGIFMLTGLTGSSPSKVMYVFKTHKNEIKGIFNLGPGCPIKPSCPISLSDAKFVEPMNKFDRRTLKQLNDKVLIDSFNSGFVMFDWKCLKWIFLQKTIPSCNECTNHNRKLTSNPYLFNFHCGSNFLYHSNGCNTTEYHMSVYARYLNINLRDDDIRDSFSWCNFQVHIPPSLKNIYDSKMIRCGTGGIIFLGGRCIPPQGLFFENLRVDFHGNIHGNITDRSIADQTIPNHVLWHGEISSCGNDMCWNAIDLGISFVRPIGFKLKNSVFIIDSLDPIEGFKSYLTKLEMQ